VERQDVTALGALPAFNFQEAAEHALDHAPLAMAVTDVTGRCLWANAAFERVAGYRPDELVGRYLSDLTLSQDAGDDAHLFREAAAGRVAAWERVDRITARDGTLTWIHARCWVVRDDDGEPVHVVSQLAKLTERQAAMHAAIRRLARSASSDSTGAEAAAVRSLSGTTVLAADGKAAATGASTAPLAQLPGWPPATTGIDAGAAASAASVADALAPASSAHGGEHQGFTVTLYEAAQLLNVSGSTLRRWADSGRLACVRTSGGHRRFRLADIQRLRTKRHPVSEVRVQAYPTRPFRFVAVTLQRYAGELANRTARCLYVGPPGWFERAESSGPVQALIGSLARAFATGDFHEARRALRSLMHQAQLGGATLAERHGFIQVLDAVLRRQLRELGCPRLEQAGAAQTAAAMTCQLIADHDRQVAGR
jgi:PAS domain S-box-containing protein/excisionase family DNA binding protein